MFTQEKQEDSRFLNEEELARVNAGAAGETPYDPSEPLYLKKCTNPDCTAYGQKQFYLSSVTECTACHQNSLVRK